MPAGAVGFFPRIPPVGKIVLALGVRRDGQKKSSRTKKIRDQEKMFSSRRRISPLRLLISFMFTNVVYLFNNCVIFILYHFSCVYILSFLLSCHFFVDVVVYF